MLVIVMVGKTVEVVVEDWDVDHKMGIFASLESKAGYFKLL